MANMNKRLELLEREVGSTTLCNEGMLFMVCKAGRYKHGDHCHSREEIHQMSDACDCPALIWGALPFGMMGSQDPLGCVCESPYPPNPDRFLILYPSPDFRHYTDKEHGWVSRDELKMVKQEAKDLGKIAIEDWRERIAYPREKVKGGK